MWCNSELQRSYIKIIPIFERFTSRGIDSDKNLISKIIFSKSYLCFKNLKSVVISGYFSKNNDNEINFLLTIFKKIVI